MTNFFGTGDAHSIVDHDTPGNNPGPEPDPESQAPSRAASKHFSLTGPDYFGPPTNTCIKPPVRFRGRGSKRFYGGDLSGIRRGVSISGRTSSQQQPQISQGKRRIIYSPYWEASDSESETNLRRIKLAARASGPQDIPANPRAHSRIEISSVIGGKTQGTWCTINKAANTIYNAGSYMALDRALNHLLPKHPGEDGGVYVGDWLKKEVGKIYQIFIKRAVNHWL